MKVIVLQGVPGSGKSTYARKLVAEATAQGLVAVVVSADDFFETPEGYHFDWSKLEASHEDCFRRFMERVSPESALCTDLLIVDNTNTKVAEVARYVRAATESGRTVEIHRIVCDPERAAARGTHRVLSRSVLKASRRMRQQKLPPGWVVREIPHMSDDPKRNPGWKRPPWWPHEEDYGSPAWNERAEASRARYRKLVDEHGFVVCPACGSEHTTKTLRCRVCNHFSGPKS